MLLSPPLDNPDLSALWLADLGRLDSHGSIALKTIHGTILKTSYAVKRNVFILLSNLYLIYRVTA
jgi:hypothetical protein